MRVGRTNNEINNGDATTTTPDTLEVVVLPDDLEDQFKHHSDASLVNVTRHAALKDNELSKEDWGTSE